MTQLRGKLTYSNVVSTLCLFLLLGGGAWAATNLPKRSVSSEQLTKNAVRSWKVKDHTLKRRDIASGVLPKGNGGFTQVTIRQGRNATADFVARAPCNADETVTGGGGYVAVRAPENPPLAASFPDHHGWAVGSPTRREKGEILAFAMCAK